LGLEISRGLPVTVTAGLIGGYVASSDDLNRNVLAAALRGEAEAATALTRAFADTVWTACVHATRGGTDAEAAFSDVMSALCADRFTRLRGYDGRARLQVYVVLVVRDLLSERVVKLMAIDASRGWRAFESFFADEIRRMILRMLPGSAQRQDREDAYQSVCEALLRNDLQRLRAYSGRGSPSGFILQVIENLLIDHVRTIVPRRRLPAAIQRLSALDQSIFRLIYWERLDSDPANLVNHLTRPEQSGPSVAAVSEAVSRVRQALPVGYIPEPHGPGRTIDLSAADELALAGGAEDFAVLTPEDELADGERASLLEGALAALQEVLPKLDPSERLYLKLALTGEPAREIARVLGQPVENIHRLAQKVKRRIRDELGDEAAVKKWRLSV
jgi:RNA polymerase primary sigma factor